jgi:twitching motility protein PilT
MCQRLIYSLLTDSQKEKFEATNELDLSFGIKGVGRVRMNVFRQRGSVGAALRSIPQKMLTFEELNLPPVINEIMKLHKGLVLVTGPTGSGKSTTLASMINYLNENRTSHIMTIEDPIEYVHPHKQSIVNQREVGSDTNSFATALKYVLREDPDIILVGEMRDLETISAALTIAETGHLVFATLHTTDAASSVNRIIDVFPPHQQYQIRSQLSLVLQAVFAQQLLPHISGTGRVLAAETLIVTPAIRNLIREMKIEQIYLAMQTGGKFGMQTMNQALNELYAKRQLSYQTALEASTDPDDFKRILQKAIV